MSSLLGTLALAVMAGIGFAVASSLLLTLAWPLLRSWLGRRPPAVRAQITWVIAVAPSLVPILLILICFAPGVLGLLGLHADHCLHHPGHPHLCLVHPTAMITPLSAALLVLVGSFGAGVAVTFARRAVVAYRTLVRLRQGASRELAPGVLRVESDRPFSFTAGLGRGETFVSSALAEALPPEQLDAVIEHERAHARRRDGLRRALARACSWPHRPRLRRTILAELELATEQACDEVAGSRLGDRLRLAETILAVERLLAATPNPSSGAFLAFGGSSVPARVRALLEEPDEEVGTALRWMIGIFLVALCLLIDPIHHATEHLLGWLLGAH